MTVGRARTRKRQSDIQIPWKWVIRALILLVLTFLSYYSVDFFRQPNQFPIHQVKVYGVKHIDAQETQKKLLPFVNKGFFSVEVEQIKDQLLQIPWVADVSVRRIWPDQVVITVAEKTPVARWNDNSLLSSTGEVFSPASTTWPMDLPHLTGPEGKQLSVLAFYSKVNAILDPLNMKISHVALMPYLSWDIEFANGMKMRLGYKDVLTRVSHFVKVYPKIVGQRAADVDYVDLRYPNGLAVRWKTVS